MSFNLDKLISQLEKLTYMMRNIRRTMERSGNDSVNLP